MYIYLGPLTQRTNVKIISHMEQSHADNTCMFLYPLDISDIIHQPQRHFIKLIKSSKKARCFVMVFSF